MFSVFKKMDINDVSYEWQIFAWDRQFLVYIFTNPSARAGYDTRSIFKRSLAGLNSEFSFS